MTLQYFEYISPAKIRMLLPQLKTWRDKLPRLSPKVEFAGLSVGADLDLTSSGELVADTRKVIERLAAKRLLVKITDQTKFGTSEFYEANGVWSHGLYYLETFHSVSVLYIVWRECGSTLLLLVGSPANVLGGIVARDGQYISTSGDALECVGTGKLRRDLRQELEIDPSFFSSAKSIRIEGTPQPDQHDSNEPPLFSPALDLANLCHRRLMGLQKGDMQVAFRLMSRHEAKGGSLLDDLKQAHEEWVLRDRTPNPRAKPNPEFDREYHLRMEEGWQATIALAETSRWRRLNAVCVGSPLYTALGTG